MGTVEIAHKLVVALWRKIDSGPGLYYPGCRTGLVLTIDHKEIMQN